MIFLEVGEVLCLTIDVYCLLKLSAILIGLVRYLPLNFIALLFFSFGCPLMFRKNLNSLPGSDFVFILSMFSLHFSCLYCLIEISISWFSIVISGEVGFVFLRSSLFFIFIAVSVGTLGKVCLIFPCGMQCFAEFCSIFLKACSPL